MDAQGPTTPHDDGQTPGSNNTKSTESKEPWKITNPAKWRLPSHLRKEKTKEQLEDERAQAMYDEAQMHKRAFDAEERCRELAKDLEQAIAIGNENFDAYNQAAETISELEGEAQELESVLDDTHNRLVKAEADNDDLRNSVIVLLQMNRRLLNGQPGLRRRIRDNNH